MTHKTTKLNAEHEELSRRCINRVRACIADMAVFDDVETSDDSNPSDLAAVVNSDHAVSALRVALHLLETVAFEVDDALSDPDNNAAAEAA
ncbi:hypothetical protein M2323_002733 [Rhodoblastus acidophilus]|uniref:hypothetical protein n=1 Tax=Rhodoblastus acidophilus TaxID=1074 RepID=UPI002224B319|nr:hypothetical protein [Rhodoblastus acidophilus]MCW2284913.1 hypothetical protein [Rhodoblastus acidophilus]MCW2333797.1 hypothetical protein [Rhodoblastus acidophilus]